MRHPPHSRSSPRRERADVRGSAHTAAPILKRALATAIFRLERGKIPGAMGPLPMKTAFALLTATSLSIQLHAQSSAPAPARTNAPSRRDAAALVSPEVHTN